jgi:hypothetical protein
MTNKGRQGHKKVTVENEHQGTITQPAMRTHKPTDEEIPAGGKREGVHISKAHADDPRWGHRQELVAVEGEREEEKAAFKDSDTAFMRG